MKSWPNLQNIPVPRTPEGDSIRNKFKQERVMSDMGDIEDLLKLDPREPFEEEPEFPQDEDELVICLNCNNEHRLSQAKKWHHGSELVVGECPLCTCWECGRRLKDGHTPGCLGVD